MLSDCGCKKPDRYVSFIGIDCQGKARQIMEHIDRHRAIAAHNNAFWDYFAQKRASTSGPQPDNLLLIHSNLGQIRELFDLWGDEVALAHLDALEQACC